MFIKNVSDVPRRIITSGGAVRALDGQVIEVKNANFDRRFFVEVDEQGNPKSVDKVRITEDDKRTLATDNEPVAATVVKALDVAPEVAAPVVVPVEVPVASPAKINTTESVFGKGRRTKL